MWLLLLLLSPALAFHMKEPPPPPASLRSGQYEEHWLNVRLNHFKAADTDTFPMRFYFNPVSAGSNNIVIFVGGEWAISPGWVTGGLALDLAEQTGGSLFYTEHRYYGLTRPTNGTTVSELRFLTVDQALGDLAQFIHYVKSDQFQYGRYRNAKVALVGCSYAGTMATWMRLSYPHLIDAAFSDSGPLYAQEDFTEYLEVVGSALRLQGGQNCHDFVAQAVTQLTELLAQPNGASQVSQLFGTCTTLAASLPMDVATFHWYGVIYPFAWLVQAALPGQVQAVCGTLTNTTISDPVQRLAAWVRSQPWSQPCIETRYTEVVNQYTNTSFDFPGVDMRVWFYQTCVEYGWYQTTNSNSQPFGSGVPLYYFHQMCRDFYSAVQTQDRLQYGIRRTNLFFGGRHIPDNVVTVQGQFDPWHPMGPNETDSTPLTPVYFVPEISHCRIIYSVANSESMTVNQTKQRVLRDMVQFMTGSTLEVSSATSLVCSLALVVALALALM